jgi:hypothetical protein
MEAVGAIGSIVQIIDATAKLINYAKDVHAAEKQIFSVQTEIEVIRHILCALNTSVDESPKTFHLTLTVLSAEDGVLFEFYTFLLSFKEKLVAKPGRKLLWPFDKSRIKQDLEKIQRYKTILVCALLNDSMYVCPYFFRCASTSVTTLALFMLVAVAILIIRTLAETNFYLDY